VIFDLLSLENLAKYVNLKTKTPKLQETAPEGQDLI
jgi:hypothetical protein